MAQTSKRQSNKGFIQREQKKCKDTQSNLNQKVFKRNIQMENDFT